MVVMMGFDRLRAWLGRLRRDLDWMWGLRGHRPRVLWFHWRARRQAWRTNDLFSVASVTRPADMRVLLKLTRGRSRVVELGTATAWTAITLALDDNRRRVVTYDVIEREEAKRYLNLVGSDVRDRIELVVAPGCTGPRTKQPVDLLYIDSSHAREHTIAEVRAWQPYLRSGAPVIFDDYTHPDYPGVREAIEDLGLDGEVRGEFFIHRHTDMIGTEDA
jgi:predicted O-methyltransferase YrrM